MLSAAGYRANLAAAGDSDARLLKQLQEHASSLTSLSIDAAVSQMPRLQVSESLRMRPLNKIKKLCQSIQCVSDIILPHTHMLLLGFSYYGKILSELVSYRTDNLEGLASLYSPSAGCKINL